MSDGNDGSVAPTDRPQSEQRPEDLAKESRAVAREAAELAEHIRDTDPRWRRAELLNQLIEMIDDAHEAALTAEVRLEDE